MWNLYLSEEYDHLIGRDLSNLQNWQKLCEEVGLTGVKEMFTSSKKCKTVGFLFFSLYMVEEKEREVMLTVFRLCRRCM